MAAVAEGIRLLRQEKGWTQEELAGRVGLRQKQISSYERGATAPSSQTLIALAKALGASIDDLTQLPAQASVRVKITDRELLERLQRLDKLSDADRGLVKEVIDLVLHRRESRPPSTTVSGTENPKSEPHRRSLVGELPEATQSARYEACAETIEKHKISEDEPGAASAPFGDGDPVGEPPPRDRLGPVRDRLEVGERRAAERKARAWVRQVVKLPPAERRSMVAGAYVRFQGALFCLLLLEEARRRIPGDPAEAESLADTVLAANRKTDAYKPDPEVEAAALAVRGNARRALGRLLDAADDLAEAKRLLDSPEVSDPETPAEVFSYLGSLRKDQGCFDEAAAHLYRAAALYGLLPNREKAVRILLKLGLVHYARHECADAVAVTEDALVLLDSLDSDSTDWLRGYAHYNLAHHLHAAGETERAEAELAAHEKLLSACGDEVVQHVIWLRARIAWSRQDLAAAQRLYTEARQRALDRGIAWDAGLVGLELALVHLVRGHTAKVRKLASEALGIFAEQQVEREVRAALDLLDTAAQRDAVTRELLEQAINMLQSAAHHRPAAAHGSR